MVSSYILDYQIVPYLDALQAGKGFLLPSIVRSHHITCYANRLIDADNQASGEWADVCVLERGKKGNNIRKQANDLVGSGEVQKPGPCVPIPSSSSSSPDGYSILFSLSHTKPCLLARREKLPFVSVVRSTSLDP